ncbi:MAG: amidophosphoribosyltransferase [Clostridiales bacterium]|nr:amidophosphoribosyltransferase [Clostridiales bacterium]
MYEGLHEECGVFGIRGAARDEISSLMYYGLFALQHRGQESCGIAVNDDAKITCRKDMGLVGDVFDQNTLEELKGDTAIGHVRYSTTGASTAANAQPLVTHYVKGTLSIVHNGNLTNCDDLRKKLEDNGAIFSTTTDSEVICYLIAGLRSSLPSVEAAVAGAMEKIKGGYALLVMSPAKLIAARDPYGLKPLCMGRIGDAVVFASESCALAATGAEFVRDIEPGEVVTVSDDGIKSEFPLEKRKPRKCIFEYIYFARPDSRIDGISVFESRIKAGEVLANKNPVEADVVTGVPESGIDAALGFSQASGIPYVKAFVKNSYVGRTFIKPTQQSRKSSVKIKLNPISEAVKGKRVVMCDDSIVRGTTIANIVKMLRDAGATEVHVRISSPPFMHPCFYGTDVPSCENLIACHHSIEEITEIIGADSLVYLSAEELADIVDDPGRSFCDACFTGDYPVTEGIEDNIR